MFDAMHDRQVTMERFSHFLSETGNEPMVAAILTLCVSLKEAAWMANPTDSDGQINVNISGDISTGD